MQNGDDALLSISLAGIHLNKVISERFQSHFSEYALMILKRFLSEFVQLYGQKFSGVWEIFSCTSSFFG